MLPAKNVLIVAYGILVGEDVILFGFLDWPRTIYLVLTVITLKGGTTMRSFLKEVKRSFLPVSATAAASPRIKSDKRLNKDSIGDCGGGDCDCPQDCSDDD